MSHHALVTVGSNIAPEHHLVRAARLLQDHPGVEAPCFSRVWRSPAIGGPGPAFLNAAVAFGTALDPAALKWDVLRPLEHQLGRRRHGDRNAPRTIDLDLALYDDLCCSIVGIRALELPDPEIVERAHLALPLADIAPERCHPVDGRGLKAIADMAPGRESLRLVWLPGWPTVQVKVPSGDAAETAYLP